MMALMVVLFVAVSLAAMAVQMYRSNWENDEEWS